MDNKRYVLTEDEPMIAAEPAAVALSDSVSRTGLLGQVMKLSRADKVALIKYLKLDIGLNDPFKTDEYGRIELTPQMREAAAIAERDYEEGKCLSENDFKQRFAKWL